MKALLKYMNLNKRYDMISFVVPIIDELSPIGNSPNQKYDNEYFLICLMDFVKKAVSWSKYQGTIDYPISGKYLNQIHLKWVRKGVYKAFNRQLIVEYLKNGKGEKIKNQSLDSTFIPNKGGSIKNNNHLLSNRAKRSNRKIRQNNKTSPKKKREQTFIDHNRYNGRKAYFKVSTICDAFGTPLGTTIVASKYADCHSVEETINSIPVDLHTLRNSKVGRHKQNLLADAGYDTKSIKDYTTKLGYKPIIAYNKRGTKDQKIINEKKLKGKDLQTYKKRGIIEAFFSWIKGAPIINQNYEKTIESYEGLFSLASSIIIYNRI